MGFVDGLLPRMACPGCGQPFGFLPARAPGLGRGEFGTLTCQCSEFPVVDGIPILLKDRVRMFEVSGTADPERLTRSELVTLVKTGRCEEALVRCLAPPTRPKWARIVGWRVSSSNLAERILRWQGLRNMRTVLMGRDRATVRSLLGFFFNGETLGPDFGDYLRLRFSQPRYLAAMSLVASLEPAEQPVLDIACGIGHLAHYLTRRSEPTPVIGVDFNFHHVWIARHFMAPGGHFACVDAGDGLPFRSGSMSATVVSDAYHYLPNRPALLREVDRVAPGRCRILTRVGNRAVMPNEGAELLLGGYLAELGDADIRVFSERALVSAYLARRNPMAGPFESDQALGGAKWLSFVSRGSPGKPAPAQWPHGVGRLAINPVYDLEERNEGVRLTFRFPRPWYAFENHQSLEYHPTRFVLEPGYAQALRAGELGPIEAAWLDQFIVVGLPERF